MARNSLDPERIERIQSAPRSVTDAALAAELGVTDRTVRKYRREAREARQEAARAVIAQHVEENVPDALSDLSDLRRIAREKYEGTGDARQGQLWLGAIKTTLEHVTPDDADLDAAIEAELERLTEARQGAGSPALAAAGRNGNGHQ